MPDAEFHAVYRLRPSNELLALEGSFKTVTYLPVANPWRQCARLYELIHKYRIDSSISFFGNYDYRYNLVLSLARIKRRAGFDHPRPWLFSPFLNLVCHYQADEHEAENNIRLAGLLGAEEMHAAYPEIERSNQNKEAVRRIAIHVGRYNKDKPGWSVEKFMELISLIRMRWEANISIFGGEEELSIRDAFDEILSTGDNNHIGRLNVEQTLAQLNRQDLMISNDTGPMHLAAMCDIPVIALFGPTDSIKSAPYPGTPGNRMIVSSNLSCQPCYPNRVKQFCQGRVDCLEAISAEKVLAACEQYLK